MEEKQKDQQQEAKKKKKKSREKCMTEGFCDVLVNGGNEKCSFENSN